MKIKLIYPSISFNHRRSRVKTGNRPKKGFFPPLNLCLLAALAPPDIEVSLCDENNSEIDFDDEVDLVGITSMTSTAPRMYDIADRFRARGITVVLGGSHVSALPEEALQHADAVVVGEAEESWPRLLRDFQGGTMESIYKNESLPELCGHPLPKREILKPGGYYYSNTVQTTRGCPFDCSFCSVTKMFGGKYRYRPIDEVLEEISALKGMNIIGFTDDNIMANRKRSMEFFERLRELKIIWGGQATIINLDDDELLEAANASGCRALFLGLESVSPESLADANKSHVNDPRRYLDIIKKIQKHKIRILGSFVFGFDNDTESVFEETVAFAEKARLELAQFSVLTPFPGTDLYQKLDDEGRIFNKDWSKYYQGEVVYHPAKMSPDTLRKGQKWAWDRFYRHRSIIKRNMHLKGWLPATWMANRFFYTISFKEVSPMINWVQKYWSMFDRSVRDKGEEE
jgi:radical SAM superfamily enzyme YgiQ (UPF0313 family)